MPTRDRHQEPQDYSRLTDNTTKRLGVITKREDWSPLGTACSAELREQQREERLM